MSDKKIVKRHVGELWIDPTVQRALKKKRVERIVEEFDPDSLGVLITSYRSPRRIHIIDGQHRYAACSAKGYNGEIDTLEYSGLTLQQEAAMFRKHNASEKPSRIDLFLVRCVEGDPAALSISKYLAENGWEVATSGNEGKLSAIASLERVYDLDHNAARAALSVLTAAYGHRAPAVQGSLIEGVGRVLARYGQDVDLADLTKRLASVPGGPDGLVGNARGQQLSRSGNLSMQVARVVVNLYNLRRRTTALPDWS